MSLVRRRTTMRIALVTGFATAGAAGVGGCARSRAPSTSSTEPTGSGAAEPPTGPADATSRSGSADSTSVPAPTGDATRSAQVLQSRDDLVSPVHVTWDSWELVDPRTIEVTFLAGPAQCEGVNVDVVETDQDVTINLSVGSLPDAGACPAIALISATRVTLDAELGSRQVRQDTSM